MPVNQNIFPNTKGGEDVTFSIIPYYSKDQHTYHSKIQCASSMTTACTDRWYGVLWKSSSPSLHDRTASGWVKTRSYLPSLNKEEFEWAKSNSTSSLLSFLCTLRIAAVRFPWVLLLIWSRIREFNGETTITIGWIVQEDCDGGAEFTFSKSSAGNRWKIMDFP